MGIQVGLPEISREALELEGRACYRKPPPTGRKVFYGASCLEEIDPNRVRRLKKIVEAEKPGWVERVRREAGIYDEEIDIIFWSEVPPEPALAILQILVERGELPQRD